jgi:hypothetical protein
MHKTYEKIGENFRYSVFEMFLLLYANILDKEEIDKLGRQSLGEIAYRKYTEIFIQEGFLKGKLETNLKIFRALTRRKTPLEDILDILNISLEEYAELEKLSKSNRKIKIKAPPS